MTTRNRLTVTHVTPAYWRVSIENPPINLYDPEMFAELNVLVDQLNTDKDVKVVVFESANPDYFIAHYDIVRGDVIPDQPGAADFGAWPQFVTRLAQSRVVSIAKVRGRARGHGSELTLACDIRFASKEKAIFSQPEVGVGVVAGGGATRSPASSRAPAAVGRSSPRDARSARAGIPSEADRWASNQAFVGTTAWPETRARIGNLLEKGLQQAGDLELHFGKHLGPVAE